MMQLLSQASLMLVGCGVMGSALLRGWLQNPELFHKIFVVSPHQENILPFLSDPRVSWVEHPDQISQPIDLILFAVKPQILPQIISFYPRFIPNHALFLTVAAGLGMDFYQTHLPQASIIRMMPNTPATIMKGMSGLYANRHTTQTHCQVAEYLMQQIGSILWVENDDQMDRVTAISGCGPAYVFLLTEALQNAAEHMGFDTESASLLAYQTVVGSAAFLEQSKKSPRELRNQVTSPGGTTAAALASLQQNDQFDIMITEALDAALKRALELRTNL